MTIFLKNTLNIINVGRFTNQKDHLTLLKAINIVKDKINLRLMIIGRGVNLISMKKYIIDHNLKKLLRLLILQIIHFLLSKNQNCLSLRQLLKDCQMYCLKL